jgi:hypothetical protein
VLWVAGEPAMGAPETEDAAVPDGPGDAAPDGAGDPELDPGETSVVIPEVMITEGSCWSSSSMMKSFGSAGSAADHAHAAASSKTMSRLMWTRRVEGS